MSREPKDLKRIERRTDDSRGEPQVEKAGLPAKAGVAPFDGDFTIDLSACSIQEHKRQRAQDRNQERMYLLREAFAASPEGAKYKWLPHAIEAYIRQTLGSNMLAEDSPVKGLHVEPEKGRVLLVTEDQQVGFGGKEFAAELNLRELENFSAELLLNQLNEAHPLEEINYSPEMQQAVEGLSASAKYRWEIIAQTAQHIAAGRTENQGNKYKVDRVAHDRGFGIPGGVGVFIESGPGGSMWSAVKVEFGDVPWTEEEKKWIEAASMVSSMSRTRGSLLEFVNLVEDVHSILDTLGIFERKHGKLKKLWADITAGLGRNVEHKIFTDLSEVYSRLLRYRVDNCRVIDKVKATILKEKAAYSEENPFQCEELPLEMQEKLKEAAIELWGIIQDLAEILKENQPKLIEVVQKRKEEKQDPQEPQVVLDRALTGLQALDTDRFLTEIQGRLLTNKKNDI